MNPSRSLRFHFYCRALYGALTMAVDALVVLSALTIGYFAAFPEPAIGTFLSQQWKLILFSITVYLLLSTMFGGYRQAFNSPARVQAGAAGKSYLLGTLLIFATLFLYRNTYYSQGALITYAIFLPLLFACARVLLGFVRDAFHKNKWGVVASLDVALDPAGREFLLRLHDYDYTGYEARALVALDGPLDDQRARTILDESRRLGVNAVIFGAGSLEAFSAFAVPEMLAQQGLAVRLVTPEVHKALTLTHLYDYAGVAYASAAPPGAGIAAAVKRLLDLAVGSLLLVIMAPVILAIALAVRLESPGSAFFRQVRALTAGSRPLRVFKFRSMRDNAEEEKESILEANGASDLLFKLKHDPRVTRVGKFLRRFSFDELPQLFNVMRGEMSFVGPRPLPLADFAKLSDHHPLAALHRKRAQAIPGMTGLWQVSGRSDLTFRDMILLDLYYVENQSILFDVELVAHTLPAVIFGKGAY